MTPTKRDWRHLGSQLQAALPDLEQIAQGAEDMATPSISTMGEVLSATLSSLEKTSKWLAVALKAPAPISAEQAVSESDRIISEANDRMARLEARVRQQWEILDLIHEAISDTTLGLDRELLARIEIAIKGEP